MRRPLLAALALALAAVPVAAQTGADAAPGPARAGTTSTSFGLSGSGFGTLVKGGQLPAGSSRTALAVLACTSQAGLKKENYLDQADVQGNIQLSAMRSNVRTVKKNGKVQVITTHRTGQIVLSSSGFGTLTISAVANRARAWHDASGFHAAASGSVAKMVLTATGGAPPVEVPVPTPGQPVTVPGFGTFAIGPSRTIERKHSAIARQLGLKITLPTESVVKVASARARITDGIVSGRFSGFGAPVQANLLGGLDQVGKVINKVMPCVGTDGKVLEANAAGVDIGGGQLSTGALHAEEQASQTRKVAKGYIQSEVANVNVGDGQLVIDAIKGQVNGRRPAGKRASFTAKNSQIGAITVNGEPMSPGDLDGFEIPSLLKVDTFVKTRKKDSMRVVPVRITLLGGSGADSVVDLGTAYFRIRPKG